ncbi:MAG: mechanosensitive ion channel family protein [Candidatus Nanohaloarchaea archaeon]
MASISTLLTAVVSSAASDVYTALPRIVTAVAFLLLAWIGIRIISMISRKVLERSYNEKKIIADLMLSVETLFLWFGAFLMFFDLLGMGQIAASLGTATGFIALGVALALKDMLADVVAGVYLLRDKDFNEGDAVKTADAEGTVRSVELRKTRLELESGSTMVLANKDVEKKWERRK